MPEETKSLSHLTHHGRPYSPSGAWIYNRAVLVTASMDTHPSTPVSILHIFTIILTSHGGQFMMAKGSFAEQAT